VQELEVGTTVYVDGPHGVFSIDQDEGPGFGFIAGGVGITGLLSMLRTMADRNDVRPAVLVYANGEWEGVAFRRELERLESLINLTVVHVLERPPVSWTGETGYVTAELLSRHLPRGYRRFQFFICGPGALMDAAEAALIELACPPTGCTQSASTWSERGESGATCPDDPTGAAGCQPARRGLPGVRRRRELKGSRPGLAHAAWISLMATGVSRAPRVSDAAYPL
jgi:ferredoxin-NADP reductase